ncbi:hyaluronan-binding protein 2-like [Takifugu rubripes]|uniref:hyaluronan-binding protein 2-like n=1 Tax=Takifugu rubripes TaxID=31033 RepID=UPI0011458BC4|nr:hyaluronan-binding protein 2-like [Takifugu rubripes]
MLTAGAFLIILSALSVHGQYLNVDSHVNYGEYSTDAPPPVFDLGDWLFDLLDNNVCDPNPCFNGGSCQMKSGGEFECFCLEPYGGKRCQKVKNLCENVRCGYGDCVVNLKKQPYYECKCKPPFQGPNCMTRESAAVFVSASVALRAKSLQKRGLLHQRGPPFPMRLS